MTIAAHLKRYLKQTAYTHAEAAERMGFSQPYFTELKTGKYTDPRVSIALKIAEELGVSVEELVK